MTPQELKNSILQLAIQGRLVPQLAEEGNAEDLYRQIQAEKQKLIKESKIKKEKPLPPITDDEKPFEIPKNWKWVRLGEISFINGGYAFKSENFKQNGIRVIRISDFNENGLINTKIVRHIFDESLEPFLLKEKDIILCMTGGTVGKSYFVKKLNEQMMTNQRVATIRSIFVHQEYINFIVLSPLIQKIIKDSKNSTNDNISMGTINSFIVPLPPLDDQKRIITKIEELLPYIERYETAYNKLQQLNKRFPGDLQKSILQLAIQGRLVPQRPEESNAENLYKQIQNEKQKLIKEGKIKKEKPLPPITDDEKPFEIPEPWKWVRLGEVTLLNPKNYLDDNIETSFIPMSLISDGYSNIHTTEIRRWADIKNGFTHFANGDIGVAKITPCFQNKKSVIFTNLENGYGAGTTELSIIRVINNTLLRKYILWFVKADYFISNGVKSFTGTAGQQRIHKDYLKNCLLPLPPFAEQIRIVAKIEELLPLCDKLK